MIDCDGALIDSSVVHLNAEKAALEMIVSVLRKHACSLVGIGNGQACRETERLISMVSQQHPELHLVFVLIIFLLFIRMI